MKQSAEAKEGIPSLLRHLDTLVHTLQLQAAALTLPAVEALGPTKQPLKVSKDTQQGRLDLHETVDAILKTVAKQLAVAVFFITENSELERPCGSSLPFTTMS